MFGYIMVIVGYVIYIVYVEYLGKDVVYVYVWIVWVVVFWWVKGSYVMGIVEFVFFVIVKNFVGLCDGFEFGFGFDMFVFGDFVGMV